MRNPARIKPFLEKLEKLWEKCPDQRLGQLITNIITYNYDYDIKNLFYLEDDKFEEKMNEFVKQFPPKNK